MNRRDPIHKGWDDVVMPKAHPTRAHSPIALILIAICIIASIVLYKMGDKPSGTVLYKMDGATAVVDEEECLSGTWVYDRTTGDAYGITQDIFVCVPDGPDGYEPPSD